MTKVSTSIISTSANSAKLRGDLTMHTVADILPQGLDLLKQAKSNWRLDLAEVEQVSSAGVALLLEWLKAAEKSGITLELQDFPERMLSIIQISGLEPLFLPLFRTTP